MAATGAAIARLSLSVRLHVGQPAPLAQQDAAANKDVAVLSAVAGSASRLLALAGVLSPGADVGVLSRAMEELERLAAGDRTAVDRVDPNASAGASTAADMDIDSVGSSDQTLGCGTGVAARGRSLRVTKRKREARRGGGGGGEEDAPGVFRRPAKRRILAWRARRYRSLVAKAKATARRARSRRAAAQAQAQPMRRRRRGKAGGWKSVEQQLARATLSDDGLHRWSPGGGGGPAEQ